MKTECTYIIVYWLRALFPVDDGYSLPSIFSQQTVE